MTATADEGQTKNGGDTGNAQTTAAAAAIAAAAAAGGGLASFEKELICSICTEVLYQPLTILNCLHTFCGSCLKEWFSHQHRKASSSRSSSSSSSSTTNPYSCPTCRAEVRDVQHNATVSNLLELFLAANPSRDRSQEEKEEMNQMYKPDGTRPGDKILPKVERRRDRRPRRDDGHTRERLMIDEAVQRSLRELDPPASTSTSTPSLAPPQPSRARSASAEREDRRARRRERERQREHSSTLFVPPSDQDASAASSPPTSSPRHPDAIETRQREQRMSHQASLRSLVSASDTGTATGDSWDEARIMQEIIDEGLLGDIDVDSLTEAEQDALAERIAELYRQRYRSNLSTRPSPPPSRPEPQPARLTVQDDRRTRSNSAQRPRSAVPSATVSETQINSQSSPPQSSTVRQRARSNSQGSTVTLHHRRRTSDHIRQIRVPGETRSLSVERPPTSASTTNITSDRPEDPSLFPERPSSNGMRTNTDPVQSSSVSQSWLQAAVGDSRTLNRNTPTAPDLPRHTQAMHITSSKNTPPAISSPVAELDNTEVPATTVPSLSHFEEPSVSCFRCEKQNLQYDIFRHCQACDVNLCMSCYRQAKGCTHWYGFGHAAEINFENSKIRDDTIEHPHVLIGRQYRKPDPSTIIDTRASVQGKESIPKTTTTNPIDRLQEGHFCDRCGSFANAQFWLCDTCNDGEWGFCKDCVQTHQCCNHPLLPVAYVPRSITVALEHLRFNNVHPTMIQPNPRIGSLSATSSRPITPGSATSNTARRQPGYDYLSINVDCDMCHQIILPNSPRYHCPFHATDFDICTSCYQSFIHHSRMRRDGHSSPELVAGWRKCPLGHRMIVLAFEADLGEDGDGGMRRVVKADLVGGWRMNENDIREWNIQHGVYATPPTSPPPTLTSRGTWSWKEDPTGTRKGTRSRSSTLTNSTNGMLTGSSSSKFPPDGGFGKRGLAYHPYWPEDGEDGAGELHLPRGAEVTEIEDVNGDWWSGVYAGQIGVFPFGYVRENR